MSELLSRPESSSIGADLRTRMEGGVELLEDRLHLLESAVTALNRPELDADDLDTLRELIAQLPRLDELGDALSAHAEAAALTRLFLERKRWVADAVTARLGEPAPSVREGLKRVLELRLREGRAPSAGETRLLEERGGASSWPIVAAALAAIVGVLLGQPGLGVLGAIFALLALRKLLPRRTAWTLLPDRLHVTPPTGPSFDVRPSSIRAVTRAGRRLAIDAVGKLLTLERNPGLEAMLTLLRSERLQGLASKPADSALVAATDDERRGKAWIGPEGVLFVPDDGLAPVLSVLCPGSTVASVGLSRLCELLAHLPPERMRALGAELEQKCDARWLVKGALKIEPTANEHLGAVVVRHPAASAGRLRLTFDFQSSTASRVLLSRLQAT